MRSALLLVLAAPFAAVAQQPAPETVIRINVNLVQVDVSVTDSKGRSVSDLKPEDFEVRQDGKLQAITNFSYNRVAALATSPSSAAPGAPAAALQPSQVRRTIVVVVDDLQLSFERLAGVRDGLKKFITRQLQPGDLMAIMRTSGGMGALQQLTADPRALLAAADALRYRSTFEPTMSYEPLSTDPEAEARQEREQLRAIGSLGAMRYVVEGLRDMPGRKLLVLFSDDLPLFIPPTAGDYDNPLGATPEPERVVDGMAPALRRLIDAASRSSVTIDTVDPRGFGGLDYNAYMANYQRGGLQYLAQETGGAFFTNNNDMSGLLQRAVDDSASYYLIGYHPDTATFEGSNARTEFRKISVRVKKPDVTVRTRSGFFGAPEPADDAPHDVALSPQAQLLKALNSPFAAGGIHLRLTPVFTESPEAGGRFQTMLYIDTRDLEFHQEPDGSHTASFDLIAASFDGNGQVVERTNRTYTLKAPAGTYAAGREEGLLYEFSHPASRPGAYQFRVALRDSRSGKLGSANQLVEAPDMKSGRLELSSLVVREAASRTLEGSAALRDFHPGAQIEYGYQVFHANIGSGAPDIEAQVRLWHDGKAIFTGALKRLDVEGAAEKAKPIGAGGSLQLPQSLPPGDYVLQVTVTDKLAKEESQLASQSIDFEIRR